MFDFGSLAHGHAVLLKPIRLHDPVSELWMNCLGDEYETTNSLVQKAVISCPCQTYSTHKAIFERLGCEIYDDIVVVYYII